jgi:hypothetical protein
MHVIVNVELFATLLIGEAHLDDANTIYNGWVGKDRGRYIGCRADHQYGQAIISREAPGSLNKKANSRARAWRLRVLHRETPSFNEWWVCTHPQTILNHIDEDSVGRLAGGCADRRGVYGHHAKDLEPGLEKQIGDGPLVVDLVTDISREDNCYLRVSSLSSTYRGSGNHKKHGKTKRPSTQSHSSSPVVANEVA